MFLSEYFVFQPSGRSSRRASESSTHSGGRERSNSAVKQASPPPPSIPEQPRKEEARKAKKDSPEKVNHFLTISKAAHCSITLFNAALPFHANRVKAGHFGPLGREKMRLTCQMIKILL